MKATGIIRRIDDLGRVVIPKEIRRTFNIKEGDPLEIYVTNEGILYKKYSAIGALGDFAQDYAESLNEATGQICLITDRDQTVAVSGVAKKEYLNKPVDNDMEKAMDERKSRVINKTKVIAPIIVDGNPAGTVIIIANNENIILGEMELKLAETAAAFLRKQMEQ
jgi:AbrB family transcriptional regulator (stage V sporulation protein T)